MKLLHIPEFVDANLVLDEIDCGSTLFRSRLELFSCKATCQTKKLRLTTLNKASPTFCFFVVGKATGQTRKLRVSLDTIQNAPVVLSPTGKSPTLHTVTALLPSNSPDAEPMNAKTLLNLTDTLFELFPDYDFSTTTAEQFTKEPSVELVINNINSSLSSCLPNYQSQFAEKWWNDINREIDVKDCTVFTYVGDPDPFSASAPTVWSFNYFFVDNKRKRILIWSGALQRRTVGNSMDDDRDNSTFVLGEME